MDGVYSCALICRGECVHCTAEEVLEHAYGVLSNLFKAPFAAAARRSRRCSPRAFLKQPAMAGHSQRSSVPLEAMVAFAKVRSGTLVLQQVEPLLSSRTVPLALAAPLRSPRAFQMAASGHLQD